MKVDLGGRAGGIFLEALDRDATDREAYLSEACGDDAELRAQVEHLLAHHREEELVSTTDRELAERVASPGGGSRETELMHTGELVSRAFGGPRQRAVISVLIALAVLGLGAWARQSVLGAIDAQTRAGLESRLLMEQALVKEWMQGLFKDVSSACQDHELAELAETLAQRGSDLNLSVEERRARLQEDGIQAEFEAALGQVLSRDDLEGYALVHTSGVLLAAMHDEFVGRRLEPVQALSAEPAFFLPSNPESWGSARSRLDESVEALEAMAWFESPVLFRADTPDGKPEPLASLIVGAPAREFTRILDVAQSPAVKSSESYAVDAEGFLRSRSRFSGAYLESLAARDIEPVWHADNPVQPGESRVPSFALLDPGARIGQLAKGSELNSVQYTRIVQDLLRRAKSKDATAPTTGVRMEPYRDYRGIPVVGAWAWFSDYGFALVTEIDAEEAFAARSYVDLILLLVLGLLGVILLFGFSSSFAVVRLRKRVQEGTRLGPYTLTKRIGEGGLGEVYLARHALLKRPTAIKILKPSQVDTESLARFEREVQLASQLTCPNTIAVYDFGRTLEGTFYCAMEFLDGMNLSEVVRRSGDLDPARVVHVMRGACASLAEAHERGLVHRDVKPMNMMLCVQGGHHDVVKLLDFGLVKDVSDSHARELTKPTRISGTLLYLAPERLRDPGKVDGRTDIYSLGAVAYYLLTGKHHLAGGTDVDLLDRILREVPAPPSQVTDQPIPPELDELVVACLAKDMDDRPADVAAVLAALDRIADLEPWTEERAAAWWRAHCGS